MGKVGVKRGTYRAHTNHAVTCAVCGKIFGASRSTAKYCGATCRRQAYYAKMGYLTTIEPDHVDVPDIRSLIRINNSAKTTARSNSVVSKAASSPAWRTAYYIATNAGGFGAMSKMANNIMAAIDKDNALSLNSRSIYPNKPAANTRFRASCYEPTKEQRERMADSSRLKYTATRNVVQLEVYGDYTRPTSVENVTNVYIFNEKFSKTSKKR